MSEQNKAVVRRLIDEVWNRRAFDVADELFAPEAIIYESGVALPGAGPAVVKEGIGAICAAYPDIRTTIDDTLSTDPPGAEEPDRFRYDPMDPVPTVGAAGIHDQRRVEARIDVLVYSTTPLEEDLEVTGPVKVILHASSSAGDTDFTAKLVDVGLNGYAANLCDGIIRARYRKSLQRAELIEPGRAYEYTIDLVGTSNRFLRGHRIRLEISSSNFPRFDRNPNRPVPAAMARETVTAEQTIFHDAQHLSHVMLPIIRG